MSRTQKECNRGNQNMVKVTQTFLQSRSKLDKAAHKSKQR